MVKGLELFRAYFAAHAEEFVLIGGTAAARALGDAGLDFRATKDIDIVLHVEALTPGFASAFWKFIDEGGYQIRQAADTGKPAFYRFHKPADQRFPAMLELFSRVPSGLVVAPTSHLTPIPIEESVVSLSAILLDEDYYEFIVKGQQRHEGLPWIGEDRLIPLKASAWLDLRERLARGDAIDARNVRKHANDVIRLSQLLTADVRIPLPGRIAGDLERFLRGIAADDSINPASLGVRATVGEICEQIARAYLPHDVEDGT